MIWAMQRLTFLLYRREELKRAESENKQLRESCIETRDTLELAQQNYQKALNDLHNQALTAARREEDTKEKMKALKKELQVLCPNCVIALSWFTCKPISILVLSQMGPHLQYKDTCSLRT